MDQVTYLFATFTGEDDNCQPETHLFYARRDAWAGDNDLTYDHMDDADDTRIEALVRKLDLDYVLMEHTLCSKLTPDELRTLVEAEPDFAYDAALSG